MKRNLFDELNEGLQALRDEREGKITLKKHTVEKITAPELKTGELVELRQKLNVSQAVFAQYLRINKRTLENWEQGRAMPEFRRSLLDVEAGSASVLDYLRINRNALLARWVPSAVGLNAQWPGLVAVVFGVLGGTGVLRRRATPARPGFANALRARFAGWGDGGYFLLLGSVAEEVLNAFLNAKFSTEEQFRRRVQKLEELDSERCAPAAPR